MIFVTRWSILQVFLPTGLIMDQLVHPDEEIFFIKQQVVSKATTDGKIQLEELYLVEVQDEMSCFWSKVRVCCSCQGYLDNDTS